MRIVAATIIMLAFTVPTSAQSTTHEEFAKIFGVVRYYTPNPHTEKWNDKDWAYIASYLLYKGDNEKLGYTELFAPLSPHISVSATPQNGSVKSPIGTEQSYYWHYRGGGTLNIPAMAKILLASEVNKIAINSKELRIAQGAEGTPAQNSVYSYEIAPKRYLNVVHAQPEGNFSKSETNDLLKTAKDIYYSKLGEPFREKYWNPVANKYARLGSTIGIWNAVRHFYPYIDRIEEQWNAALPKFIALASTDKLTASDYLTGQLQLLSIINDGHLALWPNFTVSKNEAVVTYVREYFVPLEIDYIDEKVYLKNDAFGFQKFDVITKINGTPTAELIEQKSVLVSAATKAALEFNTVGELLKTRIEDEIFIIEAQRLDGSTIVDTLKANLQDRPYPRPAKGERIKELGNGVLYYDATQQGKPSKREIEQLVNAKAVIYDIRQYPDYDFLTILSHLHSDLKIPSFPQVNSAFPFAINSFEEGLAEELEALTPQIKSKSYFLSSRNSISWAETILQIVRGNNLGEIVGETSAGTNGDITRFYFPIFQLTFTGRKAYNTDGSDFFGIGVVPDHFVNQSYESQVAGRDDIIDYTLKLINDEKK